MPKPSNKERKEMMKAVSMLSQVGITILVCIGLGVFVGIALDRWLGTDPWMLLLFIFLGIVAAFKSLYEQFKRLL